MQKQDTRDLCSQAKFYESYSRFDEEKGRYETWNEAIERVMDMHREKYKDQLDNDPENKLNDWFEQIEQDYKNERFLGAQRALQYAGPQILKHNVKIYNCASSIVNRPEFFGEYLYALLGGCGVGYSIQKQHVHQLPKIKGRSNRVVNFTVPDSIEGWAEALDVLLSSYFEDGGKHPDFKGKKIYFDFSKIRPKGSLISGGFKAPGPEPLRDALLNIERVLDNVVEDGGTLRPIHVYDINCFAAEAVLSGGLRRAATAAIFSPDDEEMLKAKTGNWFVDNPQRALSNNSAVLYTEDIDKITIDWFMKSIREYGEPGFVLTNDPDKEVTYNPCSPSWAPMLKPNGMVKMEDVQEGDCIWSKEGWTQVVAKWCSGVKDVYRYRTAAGVFYGTKNHRIVQNGEKIEVDDAQSIDALVGDGDFEIEHDSQIVMKGFSASEHSVPEQFKYADRKTMASYLRGLFSANGSFERDKITFKTTFKQMCEDVQLMLSALGIYSNYTINNEDEYEVDVLDVLTFKKIVEGIRIETLTDNEVYYPENKTFDIIDVEYVSTEPVYDITVDNETHTYWTGNCDVSNCFEIGKYPKTDDGRTGFQFCCLVEINGKLCDTEENFLRACESASAMCTLQAGYTDFRFFSDATKEITDREALIGVSITGWMNNPDILFDEEVLDKGVQRIKEVNEEVADLININPAARLTTTKPAGNSSVLLKTANGIHGEHSPYYFRHVQMNKDNEIAQMFIEKFPEMVEDSVWSKGKRDIVVAFPFVSPENSVFKDELIGTKQLSYVKKAQKHWVEAGTVLDRCVNKHARHNVSNTIQVDDWEEVCQYVFDNKKWFAGISFLPLTGDKDYPQAPNAAVLTEDEIVGKYGSAAMFASGLICQGLDTFDNDLWLAINTAKGMGLELSEDGHEDSLKRDFVKRFKRYADRYFNGDVERCEACLKDVYYLHKWEKIQAALGRKSVNWKEELTEKSYTDVGEMAAVACAGGACEI